MTNKYEDYLELFPEHKRMARGKLLCEAAQMAVDSVNKKIKDVHGDDGAVSVLIGDARAEKYVSEYIDKVIRFKMANGIGPQSRVEAPKIAAILIATLHAEPITDLFGFKPQYSPGKAHTRKLFVGHSLTA